jgi:hypothetical protein
MLYTHLSFWCLRSESDFQCSNFSLSMLNKLIGLHLIDGGFPPLVIGRFNNENYKNLRKSSISQL